MTSRSIVYYKVVIIRSTEDADYLPLREALVFTPTPVGASRCISVSLVDDYAVELDENFLVYLNTTDESVTLHPVWAYVTITDSDGECCYTQLPSQKQNYVAV